MAYPIYLILKIICWDW